MCKYAMIIALGPGHSKHVRKPVSYTFEDKYGSRINCTQHICSERVFVYRVATTMFNGCIGAIIRNRDDGAEFDEARLMTGRWQYLQARAWLPSATGYSQIVVTNNGQVAKSRIFFKATNKDEITRNMLIAGSEEYDPKKSLQLWDSVLLETAVNTISHEYLLEFTSEYGISEMLHPELPGPGDRIVDFPKGKAGEEYPQCYTKPLDSLKNWNNRFFWVDECVFPTAVEWRTNASKDGMPASGTYSVEAVRALDTHHTQLIIFLLIAKMDLFNLIRAPNPTKVKTGSRPRASHELPLLTLTAPYVINMDELAAATDSSGVPSTIERSPLDFAHEAEASGRETAAPEMPPPEESRKRGHEGIDANTPLKSMRRDHADFRPSGVPADVSDPDPLAFADA
nr:hypothetical protein [Tanacetum cinerariifolium]